MAQEHFYLLNRFGAKDTRYVNMPRRKLSRTTGEQIVDVGVADR
jgi:hypothetical protein